MALGQTETTRNDAPGPALPNADPEAVGADGAKLREAADFVEAEFAAGRFPGAALAVTCGGKKVLERFWGTYANPDGPSNPLTAAVATPLFSFSKSLTATVTVMAHQDGLVDYDAPVSKYIPDFKGGGKDEITVRHLLTHSAGLTSVPLEPTYGEDQWRKAIDDLSKAEVEWKPGSKTAYHAVSGMLLAAEVVRRVSDNRPWADIVRTRLIEPLGAEGFTFDVPVDQAHTGIVPPPKEYPCPIDPTHVPFLGNPAGGAYGRADDMLKLLVMHLNRGVWNGRTLIKPEAWEEMHRVQYRDAIDAAKKAGENRAHEYWGLGWLLRGDTKDEWFGLGSVTSAQTFGHAGIDTVIGVADPSRDTALAFFTTASPGDGPTTIRIRNGVTDRVMSAVPPRAE